MQKELLCIVCPSGCRLQVEQKPDGSIEVNGNGCKRGIAFAQTELTNPTRSLTTTVRTSFAGVPVLPVRTDGELPKPLLAQAMQEINRHTVAQRIGCGDTVLENLAGTSVRLIATSDILLENDG